MLIASWAALTSIAVPPAPEMVPELEMAPVKVDTCEPMNRPVAPAMVPVLVMPPVKVGPVIATAMRVATTLAWLLTMMPMCEALMIPLSTMAPLIPAFWTRMPVLAVIVPELVIFPSNDLTRKESRDVFRPPTTMPKLRLEIVPALLMLPEKLWILTTPMPEAPAEMVPAFVIPPAKLASQPTSMPAPTAEMLAPPLLVIPPMTVDAGPKNAPTAMPVRATMIPLLVMPPPRLALPKCATESTMMP